MKHNSKYDMFYVALLFVVLCGSVIMQFSYKENLTSGIYPDSVTRPLLDGVYTVKKNPQYDNSSSQDIYKNYPTFSSKHCGTNNIRYWRRPTNGQCTPAGMCMGLYDATEPTIPSPLVPPKGTKRVNYFVSSD